jgi:tetratricopeptide (TPR) repeat protein
MERHARHFAEKMRDEGKTKQSGSAESLARVESALPNLVQAWDHAVRNWQAADMRVFFVVLSNLFIVRSTLATAIQVFGERLDVCRERWGAAPDPSQAAVLSGILERLATFRNLSGSRNESRPLLDEALELAARSDERDLEPRILGTLGVMEAQAGHGPEARRCFERMLEKLEEIGVVSQMSVALTNLANLEFLEGNYDKSTEYFSRSLEIARQQGDVLNQMRTLGSMGFMLVNAGRGEKALECLGESLEIARRIGDKRSEELALLGMADLLAREDPAKAEELVRDCLRIADAIEHVSMQGHAWLVYATIHAHSARLPEARQAVDRAVAILGDMIDGEARKRIEEIEQLIAGHGGTSPSSDAARGEAG